MEDAWIEMLDGTQQGPCRSSSLFNGRAANRLHLKSFSIVPDKPKMLAHVKTFHFPISSFRVLDCWTAGRRDVTIAILSIIILLAAQGALAGPFFWGFPS